MYWISVFNLRVVCIILFALVLFETNATTAETAKISTIASAKTYSNYPPKLISYIRAIVR